MRDVLFLIHVVSYAIAAIIAQSGAVVKIDAIADVHSLTRRSMTISLAMVSMAKLEGRIAQLAHHGAPQQRAEHRHDQANDGAKENIQYIVRRQ
jgi:hypothetical protein